MTQFTIRGHDLLAVGPGSGVVGQHSLQLGRLHAAVGVLVDDVLQGAAAGLFPLLLLLRGVAKHQQGGGHHVLRQAEQGPVGLHLLQNVADVAGADAQAPCGGDGVLGGDIGVGQGQPQVARPGAAGGTAPGGKGVVPLLAVGAEKEHQRGLGDEGLVVAGVGQRVLDGLVGNV